MTQPSPDAPALAPDEIYYGLDALLYNPQFGLSNVIANEARLAGFPELVDDRVLFGFAELKSRRAAPSIVCVWDGSGATGVDYRFEAERPGVRRVQPILESVATDLMRLSWHCWGVGSPPSPAANASAARYLAHLVWKVIETVAHGSVRVEGIDVDYESATEYGFQATLRSVWSTPVPGRRMMYIQPGTKMQINVSSSDGTSAGETAATIQTGVLTR